jgi:hypothetical protein
MAAQQTPPSKAADPAVEAELDRLAVMPIAQLRVRYREVFRADPPKAFGPDLLRRSIAYRIQEKAYGGLSRSTQRLLDQMMKAFSAKPNGKIVLPRRIKPGSVLVREWKGRSRRVMVLANGFAYDGETYSNLSEIAGLITGTKWNGPRFFGLRSKMEESGKATKAGRPGATDGVPTTPPIRSRHLGGGSEYRKRNAELARKTADKGARHGR